MVRRKRMKRKPVERIGTTIFFDKKAQAEKIKNELNKDPLFSKRYKYSVKKKIGYVVVSKKK